LLTSALVADGAVGEVASLGDGDGDLGLDAGALGGVGQHHGAQALGALLPDGAHSAAAGAGRRGARVLRRRRARRQPQRHPVRRRRPALARALGEARRGGEQEGEHKETPHPRHLTHTLMGHVWMISRKFLH